MRPRRARELFLALGKRPQCGVCLRHIQRRLEALTRDDPGIATAADACGVIDGDRHATCSAGREQAA